MTTSTNLPPLMTPRDVLDWIEKWYGQQHISPGMTMSEIQYSAGQASVGYHLRGILDRQDKKRTKDKNVLSHRAGPGASAKATGRAGGSS